MAITQDELNSIISSVLSSIRTNSKTIEQMTPATSLGETDYFEVSGGKKVSYSVLKELIGSMSTEDQDSLRTQIDKAALKSVSITTTETSATLTIQSVGKTISCTIPVASTSSGGLMSAADKVKVNSAYDLANSAKTTADNALSNAENATSTAEAASLNAANAKTIAMAAKTTAEAAKEVTDSKGNAGGIAPLDEKGLVPESNIPGKYDDVVDFKGFLTLLSSAQMQSYGGLSTDDNCAVIFDRSNGVFVIKVSTVSSTGKLNETYYNNWIDGSSFGEPSLNGRIPESGKMYVDITANKTYRWNGSEMVVVGSDLALGHTETTAFPGNEGAELQTTVEEQGVQIRDNTQRVAVVGILKADGEWNGSGQAPTLGVWLCDNGEGGVYWRSFGSTNFYNFPEEDYNSDVYANEDRIYRVGSELFRIKNNKLIGMAGSAVGNCFNVTNEVPITDSTNPYYNLQTAIETTAAQGLIQLGMQITFAIGDKSWKTYQYIGSTVKYGDFVDESNWLDTAGISAGVEPVINVTELCGLSPVDGANMLSKAIAAIVAFSESTGIEYRKGGLVLTYKTADQKWETKQFIGDFSASNAKEFENESLWKDFGGGGSAIELADDPEQDGTKAFSSGGAYKLAKQAIVDFEQSQDDDFIYYQPKNIFGEDVGTLISVPKSGGGGASNVSTLTIYFENNDSAPAFSYGSSIIVKMAAKSSSYENGEEILGTIRTIAIVDYATGLTLWQDTVNASSSTSSNDTKFTLDFTDFFSGAASKDFQIVVTDADGNTRKKLITVTALDITVTSPQTLNYTAGSALTVGGSTKSILMYRFPNNASTQGIRCVVEMYFGGEWKELGTAIITDTYSKSISINPTDVFGGGEQLTHGAYMLRIQGTDVKTGIKGNTLYTSVMCVNTEDTTPIVAIRYFDNNNGSLRLYDNLSVDVAAYTPGSTETNVSVMLNGVAINTQTLITSAVATVTKQVQGYKTDGSDTIAVKAVSGDVSTTPDIIVTVNGSAIGVTLKDGAVISYDFSTRSNSDSDHSIVSGGYEMQVNGSNWSSNGFSNYLGENCLRVAENVTAEIPYSPFGSSAVERTNGIAVQFAFATQSVADDDKMLIDCYDPESGAGFYVKGNKAAIFCKNGTPKIAERTFKCGEKITMAVVVEPSTIYLTREGTNYSTMKMYLNGEEVACIGYVSNSGAILSTKTIKFDGTLADLYIYYFLAYESYMQWAEAFQNYLCKLSDTNAMITEYHNEDVLNSSNVPSLSALAEKKIPYYVVVADQAVFDTFDSDINTSTNFKCTLYYYDPAKPWRSFKAENVRWRRQGTTSAKRPIKNDRFYLAKEKGWKITPLYPDYTTEEALRAYALMEIGYVQVGKNTIPVRIITVKVDFSDASNANDCGVCDLMNATFRALGNNYMTPAQVAYDGTWASGDVSLTGLAMNHSTANHPIAVFRSTMESLTDAWFHAKGNWKEDKGEQVALGFQKTPGYNKGCLNYGDFIEYFGTEGETLDQIEARFKADSTVDTSAIYLLSLYCGRNYRFMRHNGSSWAASSGSMKQVNGKWVITGDVLNPVSGYELLTYDGMDWWQGVNSVEDMMAPTTSQSSWVTKLKLGLDTYPAWTYYFECMIDDDQLQIDLAMGKKVPFELFNVLRFCGSCDYSKSELAETWQAIWKEQMYRYINPYSLVAYYAFTDYLAAVDQQAKNMQPMFFLEPGASVTNGVYSGVGNVEPIRMYCNKVYDCDTCNGKDNDGYPSISPTLDPSDLTDLSYAGRGSVLWNNIRGQQTMNVNDAGDTITLKGVISTMRNLPDTLGIGAGPFSPEGSLHYFVEMRLKKWPKVVSSYDGERKYISNTPTADALYFYALQGLGLTALPRFIEERWRYRDGCYECGEFMSAAHYITGRIGAKDGAVIRFTAAKDGYFAVGNDAGNVRQGMYLKAGESGVFDDFQHGDNILLYLFNADLMSELDLSEISLDTSWSFAKMTLVERLILGSETHADWTTSPSANGFLSNLQLGALPFLKHLDVRNTEITTVEASGCPRIESILADNTSMATISLAEASPIETLTLPNTMTALNFVNLPNLTYPGGLTIAGFGKVARLMLAGCPKIDKMELINGITSSSAIKYIRLTDLNITASSSILESLKNSGAVGIDALGNAYDESGQCSGLTGSWIMSDLIEDEQLSEYQKYFPQLTIYNSQYSHIIFSDAEEDTENITNADNNTGYKFSNKYVASGHFKLIESLSHAYKCTYNEADGKMYADEISDIDYTQYDDGSTFDPQDVAGEGYDIMKHVYRHWYKGVNDFKNQEKHLFVSANKSMPLSTATKITRKKLADILVQSLSAIYTGSQVVGEDYTLTSNSNHGVYMIDVEGMKQVRWPGINNATIGAVFLDANGKVLSTYNMSVSHALFDFVLGEYIFIDVPAGASKFLFTAPNGFDDLEAIAVDSDAIEAIEPDWVHTDEPDDESKNTLVAVYGASIDSLLRIRSISGVKTRTGDGNSTINSEWTYDDEGELTNTIVPTSTIHYTGADLINLCRMRGKGYQAIDYEMSKTVANLVFGLLGDRDVQAQCGYGCGNAYTTGANNFNSYGNVTRIYTGNNIGNIIFGIQNFVGCNSEWMDNVAVNVESVAAMRKNKFATTSSFPIDGKWHIRNPYTKTERVVQGVTDSTGYCIGRVKFGRYADVISSRMTTDNSKWNKWYSDAQWYTADRSRVPLRSYNSANAGGGLVCANASNAGSYSFAVSGVRLAFRGVVVFRKKRTT